MSEVYTLQSLLSKFNSLKLQLAGILDKALKLTQLESREKYIDSITLLKKEIQQLKLKLEKQHNLDAASKTYNKIVLKLNTLTGELNMKQNNHLWNKENRRKNKEEYEDLLQELVEREDKIAQLKGDIVSLKNQNTRIQEEYSQLQNNLKVILNNHQSSMSNHEELQLEKQDLHERIKELEDEVANNLSIIRQFKEIEKQNLLVCSKGAQEIHRLSQRISKYQGTIEEQKQTILRYQTRLLEFQQTYISQSSFTHKYQIQMNQSMNTIQDQQFKLKINQQELDTLKHILSKRNQQFKNIQQHYEGRIQEITLSHERRIESYQNQNKENDLRSKEIIEAERVKCHEAMTRISSLNVQINALKKQIKEKDVIYKDNIDKLQTEAILHNQRIEQISELYKQQEITNQNMISQQSESECRSLSDKNSKNQQIDGLSQRVLMYHVKLERHNEEYKNLAEQYRKSLETNEEIKEQVRQIKLQRNTLELRVIQSNNDLERKDSELEHIRKRLLKEQKSNQQMIKRNKSMQQQIEYLETKLDDLNSKQKQNYEKYRELQLANEQLREENQFINEKLQQSNRVIKETAADNLIQYQQEVKHSKLIKQLNTQISQLILIKQQNEEEINSLHQMLVQFETFESSQSQSHLQLHEKSIQNTGEYDKTDFKQDGSFESKNTKLNKSIKIKVLEDIRMIINKMA